MPKSQSPFNLESEIERIKIHVPLSELATQDVYKGQILRALKLGENGDSVNLNDDQPALLFGPKIEGKFQEGVVPLFISVLMSMIRFSTMQCMILEHHTTFCLR